MASTETNQRERLGILAAGVAVLLVVFLALYIPTVPRKRYAESRDTLENMRAELQNTQLMKLDAEARRENEEQLRVKLQARPATFDLFSHVDTVLKEMGLSGGTRNAEIENYRTRNSNPREPMVSVRLQNVALKELIALLHRLYSSDNVVALYKLDELTPAAEDKGLNCSMTLVTLKLS